MMLNPEIRLKAQQELDAVVGPNRLPALEDQSNLPYMTAILREVLRFVIFIYSYMLIIVLTLNSS